MIKSLIHLDLNLSKLVHCDLDNYLRLKPKKKFVCVVFSILQQPGTHTSIMDISSDGGVLHIEITPFPPSVNLKYCPNPISETRTYIHMELVIRFHLVMAVCLHTRASSL